MTKTKFEAMDILNKFDIPCGPILSMKEIAEDAVAARRPAPIVEVDHPTRGKYLTVGNPIKLSDSPTEVTRSPLLGEHTDEVLAELGYSAGRDGVAARSEDHLTDHDDIIGKRSAREHHDQRQGQGPPASRRGQAPRAATRSPRRRASWSATPTASRCRRKASRRAPPRRRKLAVGDGLPGRDEDRLAGHPAQDRSRRRDRRREERRRGGQGLRHDPRQRQEVQGRRARSTASRCSRCSRAARR